MNDLIQERKRLVALFAIIFTIALVLRLRGTKDIPPFDDLYHLKRIENPQILQFDPDRGEHGAFCPWPPLYDELMRPFGGSRYVPPVFFALFAAAVAFEFVRLRPPSEGGGKPPHSMVAGLTLALSPYLIGISSTGHIDHHYLEPLLVLLILAATMTRRGVFLGIAIAVALLVQTALLVAAGLAFVAMFTESRIPNPESREGTKAFAIAAIAVLIYRLTRLPGYPDSAWFLGYPHAALLVGAAIACALRERTTRPVALAAGIAAALAIPSTTSSFLTGLHFFGRDPWLSSIIEFQPMFRDATTAGTDIANLTGGAIIGLLLWRKQRTVALFATVYLLLALSSRRFLIPAIALFAISGALGVAYARKRWIAYAAALATLLPPIAWDVYTLRTPDPSHPELRAVAQRMRPLPRGRVLAPWSFGHAIDVIGRKPVVIDNFGTMSGERVFTQAIEAMLTTHPEELLRYCRGRRVHYLVLGSPAGIPATAATIGIPRELYSRTYLARRTVWARLYRGERIGGFRCVKCGLPPSIQIWQID